MQVKDEVQREVIHTSVSSVDFTARQLSLLSAAIVK
jgi:hypothetical protein